MKPDRTAHNRFVAVQSSLITGCDWFALQPVIGSAPHFMVTWGAGAWVFLCRLSRENENPHFMATWSAGFSHNNPCKMNPTPQVTMRRGISFMITVQSTYTNLFLCGLSWENENPHFMATWLTGFSRDDPCKMNPAPQVTMRRSISSVITCSKYLH
jgi:hypothetical protein